MTKCNETYIYTNQNTEHEERLMRSDYLAYLCQQLHGWDHDIPEGEVISNNIVDAVRKYMDPKYSKHEVTTLFENVFGACKVTYEAHGFKLGVDFAMRFFDAVKHPSHMDEIEAMRAFEWMKAPVALAKTDDDGSDPDEPASETSDIADKGDGAEYGADDDSVE